MRRILITYRWLYTFFLCSVTVLFGFQLSSGNWLQTDLQALLPVEQHWTDIQLKADRQLEAQFNRQVLALVGSKNAQNAFQLAEIISKKWQDSGLFQQVYAKNQLNLTAVQYQINLLKLPTLPKAIQQQLIHSPQRYFQQYAEQLVNPFDTNLLPLDQDWLGLGRFVLSHAQQQSHIQWNTENGMLFIVDGENTWVLIRGELAQHNLINPQQNLMALLTENEEFVNKSHGQWLTTSPALFALNAKQKAEKESSIMGSLGIGLTLLLLLGVFRSLKVLWLLLPIGIGMLVGIVATVFYFGQIHILTLVIGTSLVGVLIDFPLHWLTSSLFKLSWNAELAMKPLRFSFLISLFVTLLGYGLLGFTHLPVLQQTALFSAVALICAVISTVLYLPLFFKYYQPTHCQKCYQKNYSFHCPILLKWGASFISIILLVSGLYQSKWQDDIRQWISLPDNLLDQAKKISQITGIDLSNQYFLVTAPTEQQLLEKSKQLTRDLNTLQQQGKIAGYQSLNQWIMTKQEQENFIRHFTQHITEKDYASLEQIGIPKSQITRALTELTVQSYINLERILGFEISQAWKPLYLGELIKNKIAVIVKVIGVQDKDALIALDNQQDIYWQDKPDHLNQAFQHSRDQAIWLKLCSFVLASLLLVYLFGWKKSIKMLFIPVFSIMITIAIFGLLGLPITLFTVFGLLLVSAISIDYIAYIYTVSEPLRIKRVTVSLSAMTSLISFTLLGFSSTPAVASFGLSVSLGILISLFTIFKISR